MSARADLIGIHDAKFAAAGPRDRQRYLAKVTRSPGCWDFKSSLRAGYRRFSIGYATLGAHRVALLWKCLPLRPGSLALHQCGNRTCVRPDHLYWGSFSNNLADAVRHGTFTPGGAVGEAVGSAKLTELDVLSICDLWLNSDETREAIAARFGIFAGTVGYIVSGRGWKHVTGHLVSAMRARRAPPLRSKGNRPCLITESQALTIASRLAAGARPDEVAAALDVSIHVVKNIRARRTWRHVWQILET